jgi:hypothetical protein
MKALGGGHLTSSPARTARVAGIIYILVFITGTYALLRMPGAEVANLIAGTCYVAVTILFYVIFKPASPALSLLAMLSSLAGCVLGAFATFKMTTIHPLVFFGFFCLTIGILILRSSFLPHLLGYGMIFGGLGWLTFLHQSSAASLFPCNIFPGVIGEGALTLWLVLKGVDEARWKEQAKKALPLSAT